MTTISSAETASLKRPGWGWGWGPISDNRLLVAYWLSANFYFLKFLKNLELFEVSRKFTKGPHNAVNDCRFARRNSFLINGRRIFQKQFRSRAHSAGFRNCRSRHRISKRVQGQVSLPIFFGGFQFFERTLK